MEGDSRRIEKPERIATYFHMEKWTLAVITVTGIFYNVGMTAGPWFEGQLAQRLCDIILGKKVFRIWWGWHCSMWPLSLWCRPCVI